MRTSAAAAILLPLFLFTGAVPSAAKPGTASQGKSQAGLLAFEDTLFRADVDRDTAVIERGFAPDAVFVHANGRAQSRSTYIAQIQKGEFALQSVEGVDRTARIIGDVGIVRGTKKISTGKLKLSGSYLTVYIWATGRWQMLSSQSTPQLQTPSDEKGASQ